MVHLCCSHYIHEQVTFHLQQFSNPLSLLTFTNPFSSYYFLMSPFSDSIQILWTSQLTPLQLQTPLHSLLQLCFPLISFFPLMGGVWGGSGGNRHVSGREEETKKNGSGKLCMEKDPKKEVCLQKYSLPIPKYITMHNWGLQQPSCRTALTECFLCSCCAVYGHLQCTDKIGHRNFFCLVADSLWSEQYEHANIWSDLLTPILYLCSP